MKKIKALVLGLALFSAMVFGSPTYASMFRI